MVSRQSREDEYKISKLDPGLGVERVIVSRESREDETDTDSDENGRRVCVIPQNMEWDLTEHKRRKEVRSQRKITKV